MTSGRSPSALLSRIRTSWPPTLVKMTLRMVSLAKPWLPRLATISDGLVIAAAQVSTQPELLADATVGVFGVRPTTAPAISAAAASANAMRRWTRRVENIRSGPPGRQHVLTASQPRYSGHGDRGHGRRGSGAQVG